MTVERIRQAILSEAHQEADRLVADAQQRHQRRLKEATRALDEEFERRFEHARQEEELESRHKVMAVRARHNLELLERRNAILDDLFREAADQLRGLPDEAYRALLKAWAAQLPQDQGGRVLCRRDEAHRLAPLIEQLNAGRTAGAQLELTPGKRPSLGGLIYCTEKFEIDLSFDTGLERLRQELAPQVAAIVFPSDLSL